MLTAEQALEELGVQTHNPDGTVREAFDVNLDVDLALGMIADEDAERARKLWRALFDETGPPDMVGGEEG